MCLKKCQVIVELNIAAKLLSTEHSPEILGCKSQSKPIIDIFSPLWSMHMLLVTVNAFYRYSNFKENFLKSVAKQENNQSNCSFFLQKKQDANNCFLYEGLSQFFLSFFTSKFRVRFECQKAFFILQALSQNAELRTRLNRIHSESVLTEQVVSVNIISTPDEVAHCLSLTNLIAYPDIDKATASEARQVVDVFASCICQLAYWFSLL